MKERKIQTRIAGNNNAGLYYFKLNMFDEALECYNKTLELEPENSEAINNKGILFFEKNKHSTAIKFFDQALRKNPNNSMVWTNKGMVYNQLRKFEDAITCFDQALRINPSYDFAYAHKSFALYSLGRYDEVISLSELFLKAFPEQSEISSKVATMYFHLAVAHGRLSKTDIEHKEALKYYNQYLTIVPHEPVALRGKADILNHLGHY